MKPIHHAMVSARLFGGEPMEYVSIHTDFDTSKAALGDMRHRAALHSVDHGGAVMEMIYKHSPWTTCTVTDLVSQHMDDDQGFQVKLDHWMSATDVPTAFMARPRIKGAEAFLKAPEEACAQKWGGTPEDYVDVCKYYALPALYSDHPHALAISHNTFGIFFSERIFGPALTIKIHGKNRLIPTRDIGEALTLSRYGRLPTLENVLQDMKMKDWMTGSKVKASRARRIRKTQLDDLFAHQMAD
jgi:hypothetical protein